jgi:predicted GNAT family N-acyltransferase
MSTPAYVIRVAEDPADREACFAVRKEVFVGEQGVPEDIEYDAYDAVAVHVLALREDGTPLGTGRLLHGAAAAAKTGGDPAVGSLGRLAVTREARGLGVGAALVRAVEDAARAFYERLGYEAYGPEYPEAGIPHRAMRRVLRPTG